MTRRHFLGTTLAAASAPFVARGAERNGFTIGLAADAQYADVEPKGTRYYRLGVPRLAEAVEHFDSRDVAFAVHLGDLLDRDWKSFDEITKPLAASRVRWHQLLGNHDFEVLDEHKPRVPQRMGMAWRFGAFDHGAFRFVVLDTNDVSTYAHAAGTPERAGGEKELARHQAANVPQAKPWNGGISAPQLAWFEHTCTDAHATRKKVIVLAHHPVYPEGAHNVWNSADVLATIDRHPHVVAWLNGHNHAGAFAERNGVPYLTMRGMVETANTTAFATAQVLADRIVLTGHGREPSREMKFRA